MASTPETKQSQYVRIQNIITYLTIISTILGMFFTLRSLQNGQIENSNTNHEISIPAQITAVIKTNDSIHTSGDSFRKITFIFDTIHKVSIDTSIIPRKLTPTNTTVDFIVEKFWLKVAFSGILLIAALIVVLSNKYDDQTKKWAYTVLTLIAGVWIGSATS